MAHFKVVLERTDTITKQAEIINEAGLLLFESQRSLLSLPRAGLQAFFIFPLGIAYAFRLTFFALAASFAEHLLKLSRAAMRRAASAAPGVCIVYTNETEAYAASNQRY